MSNSFCTAYTTFLPLVISLSKCFDSAANVPHLKFKSFSITYYCYLGKVDMRKTKRFKRQLRCLLLKKLRCRYVAVLYVLYAVKIAKHFSGTDLAHLAYCCFFYYKDWLMKKESKSKRLILCSSFPFCFNDRNMKFTMILHKVSKLTKISLLCSKFKQIYFLNNFFALHQSITVGKKKSWYKNVLCVFNNELI